MNLSPFLSVDLKSAIVSLDRFKVAVNQAESHPEKGRREEVKEMFDLLFSLKPKLGY